MRLRDSSLPCTQPFLVYRTFTIFGLQQWNINKLCAGFEMVYSLSLRDLVLWEYTQVMMLLFLCLRLAFGGSGNHLSRSFACWQEVRDQRASDAELDDEQPTNSADHRWEGIGMKVT